MWDDEKMGPMGNYFTEGELHMPFLKGYIDRLVKLVSMCLLASLPSASGLPLYRKHWAQLLHPSIEELQIPALVQASPVAIRGTGMLICITLCNR